MNILTGEELAEFKEYFRRYPDYFLYLIVDETGSDIYSEEFEEISSAVMEARDNPDAYGIVTRHFRQKENDPDYDKVLIWKNPNYKDTTDLSESKDRFIKVIDLGYDDLNISIYPEGDDLYKEYVNLLKDIGVNLKDVEYFIDNSAMASEQLVKLKDGSFAGVRYGNGSYSEMYYSYSKMYYDEQDAEGFNEMIQEAEENFEKNNKNTDLSEAQTNYHKHVGKVNKEQLDILINNFIADVIYKVGREVTIPYWRNQWKEDGVVCASSVHTKSDDPYRDGLYDAIKQVSRESGYTFFSRLVYHGGFDFSIKIPYNRLETNKLDVKKDKGGKDIDMSEELKINEEIKDESFYRNQAEELLKNSNSYAVIYGYMNNGNFYPLPELRKCRDNAELGAHTEAVELRYHPHGSVRVVYNRNINESVNSCDTKGNLYKSLDENVFDDIIYDPKVRG